MKTYHPLLVMLLFLSVVTFLCCKPTPSMPTAKTESEADRLATCNQYLEALYPVRVKEKWGYINRKAEIVIPPTFDDADDFYGGMAKAGVLSGDQIKYGFIDSKGQWMVQPIYQKAGRFTGGMAVVLKNDLYGYATIMARKSYPVSLKMPPISSRICSDKARGWTGFIDSRYSDRATKYTL